MIFGSERVAEEVVEKEALEALEALAVQDPVQDPVAVAVLLLGM
jgi:hypothetical protein